MSIRHFLEVSDTARRDTARVGVVIPVYNRRTILLETLPFVLQQTRLPDQLLIVDDGSTDGTAEAVEAWLRQRDPALSWRVLRLPHRTAASARKQAYASLEPVDYITFLDSDDHWPADFLERTIAALDANPETSVAIVDRRYTDLQETSGGFRDATPLVANPIPHLFRYGAGVASCTLLRAAAYEAVGGWQPDLETSEDTMLFSQLAQEGPWVHAVGEPVDFYLGNAKSRGEENNLSRRYAYNSFLWARAHEVVFERVRQRDPAIDERPLRRFIARYWYIAGKELLALGHVKGARGCFARSVRWKRLQYHGWRRLLTAA
ncbi:UDP-Glc:alpha-D-GlcNAc-diphosphoundecaprenol beta-1,3-glucosyltransferase WfgD [Botrimarina colliarenosi]|uniref:UDP-Glc:alpha-D-GlcNAc-diphosphoundecaprenol beta-1,3-glucosyltransferase WfgD n=1 Tax=Botrimarina colliarenosi TaxID=2528001 RepID=A0A5C5ZZ07_9BACT|nr:glycosyltransferase family 2 protein [Botrimarina colliarenosi]TWT92320.1 UDP-Glc:alpha-D-GlcNAc-diphosphoundecaprenol beta-1,3-glucosyltransferase WfgD [Botrimarina colliarenosi]